MRKLPVADVYLPALLRFTRLLARRILRFLHLLPTRNRLTFPGPSTRTTSTRSPSEDPMSEPTRYEITFTADAVITHADGTTDEGENR